MLKEIVDQKLFNTSERYSVFLAHTQDCHVKEGRQKVTFTIGTHPRDLHSLHGRTLFADLTPIFHELLLQKRKEIKIKTITFLFRYFYFSCIVNCVLYSCTWQTCSFTSLRIRESQGYSDRSYLPARSHDRDRLESETLLGFPTHEFNITPF